MSFLSTYVFPGLSALEYFYSSPGTYTWKKPNNTVLVYALCIGGGGGGGSGECSLSATSRNGGAGGAGGALVYGWFPEYEVQSSVSITVGDGGTGGASISSYNSNINGNIGTDGQSSKFGAGTTNSDSYLIALGGYGGGGDSGTFSTGGKSHGSYVQWSNGGNGLKQGAASVWPSPSNSIPITVAVGSGGGGGGVSTENVQTNGFKGGDSVYATITKGGSGSQVDNTIRTPPFTSISSGSIAAYSLRKIYSSYAGFAIKIRRSNDNALQDIGFDVNGNLDDSAITTFCGANSGYVDTWYDQSGNSYHATASSESSFVKYDGPVIYDPSLTGVLKANGRSTLKFSLSSPCLVALGTANVDMAFSNVFAVESHVAAENIGSGPRIFTKRSTQLFLNSRSTYKFDYGTNLQIEVLSANSFPLNTLSLIDAASAGPVSPDSLSISKNATKLNVYAYTPHQMLPTEVLTIPCSGGATCSGTASRTVNGNGNPLTIGNSLPQGGLRWWNGNISEIIFYVNGQSSNLDTIRYNIMSYYGIPFPTPSKGGDGLTPNINKPDGGSGGGGGCPGSIDYTSIPALTGLGLSNGGNGGNGGKYGGGGGGGGSATSSTTNVVGLSSGAGGNGANGCVYVAAFVQI